MPTFRAATDFDAGDRPPDITSGDLNSDGKTDLVVPNRAADEIIVFLGTSNGLPTKTKLTSVDGPTNAGIGDFNRDGKMDLAVTHGEFSTAGVSILIGDGSGGFGLNNDGKLDLVTAGHVNGISVLAGDGTGNFGSQTSPRTITIMAVTFLFETG